MKAPQAIETARRWTVDHAPLPLLTHAHEVFLAGTVVLLGGALVLGGVQPGSVHSEVPHWMATGWGWSLLAGGILTLIGVFSTAPHGGPRTEWAGQLLIGWGCMFYSAALYLSGPFEQVGVASGIFLGLSAVSFWRAFKITSERHIAHRMARESVVVLRRFGR